MGLFKDKDLGKKRKCIICGRTFYDVPFSPGKAAETQKALMRLFSKDYIPASLYHCVDCGKCICETCLLPNVQCMCGSTRFQNLPAVFK